MSEWEFSLIDPHTWNGSISNLEDKKKIAEHLASHVRDGDVIGCGSGSTSFLAIHAIAKRVREERLVCRLIPTSIEVEMICRLLSVEVGSLISNKPRWCFDGADEVDPEGNLIKGRGGALARERIVMFASDQVFILADSSKRVNILGQKFAVPVEVRPEVVTLVANSLRELGVYEQTLRLAVKKDGPVITEGGNLIVDIRAECYGPDFFTALTLLPGVVDVGLFYGFDPEIITN